MGKETGKRGRGEGREEKVKRERKGRVSVMRLVFFGGVVLWFSHQP